MALWPLPGPPLVPWRYCSALCCSPPLPKPSPSARASAYPTRNTPRAGKTSRSRSWAGMSASTAAGWQAGGTSTPPGPICVSSPTPWAASWRWTAPPACTSVPLAARAAPSTPSAPRTSSPSRAVAGAGTTAPATRSTTTNLAASSPTPTPPASKSASNTPPAT